MVTEGNISNILKDTEELQPLIKATGHISKLNVLLSDILQPPIFAHTAISHIDRDTLVLHTKNSATASKLHQLNSYLLKNIQKHSNDIVKIKIKVVPDREPQNHVMPEPKAIFEGKDAFDKISAKISNGPLKLVIDRMRKNLKS